MRGRVATLAPEAGARRQAAARGAAPAAHRREGREARQVKEPAARPVRAVRLFVAPSHRCPAPPARCAMTTRRAAAPRDTSPGIASCCLRAVPRPAAPFAGATGPPTAMTANGRWRASSWIARAAARSWRRGRRAWRMQRRRLRQRTDLRPSRVPELRLDTAARTLLRGRTRCLRRRAHLRVSARSSSVHRTVRRRLAALACRSTRLVFTVVEKSTRWRISFVRVTIAGPWPGRRSVRAGAAREQQSFFWRASALSR